MRARCWFSQEYNRDTSCRLHSLRISPFPSQLQPHQAYQKCINLESLALTNLSLETDPLGLVAARLLRERATKTRKGYHQRIPRHDTTQRLLLVWRCIVLPILSQFVRLYYM